MPFAKARKRPTHGNGNFTRITPRPPERRAVKPTARAKAKDVLELKAKGVGATAIAKKLGIGRARVYQILADAV